MNRIIDDTTVSSGGGGGSRCWRCCGFVSLAIVGLPPPFLILDLAVVFIWTLSLRSRSFFCSSFVGDDGFWFSSSSALFSCDDPVVGGSSLSGSSSLGSYGDKLLGGLECHTHGCTIPFHGHPRRF